MKKIILLLATIIATASYAKENSLVQVSYTNPEKFTDFETRLGASDRLDRLKKDLSHNLEKIWKKNITDGSRLSINFTDIDMAGRIIIGIEQIREVRVDTDRSVVEFDYTITDKNGEVIKSGHEKLVNNNLARLDRSTFLYDNSRLKYEVAEMAKWIQALSKDLN